MKKKLILGIVGLVVVGSTVAIGTRAYFSEQGEVRGNIFETGTLSLKLNSAETAEAVWSIEAGEPGKSISGVVNIRNDGSIKANHIEVSASNVVTEATSGSGIEAGVPLDRVLQITELTYEFGPGDIRDILVPEYITDANKNDIIDLDDLEAAPLDNLLLQDLNTDHAFTMTVRFNPSLTIAEHQGDSVTTTLTVRLNQVAVQ